ncbi:uncharacterized protein LOC114938275 [Nylanderia fulva]|uniref:uncharacterized protein LOC114938275 n=1 Tax=Nylanderia fulva TaxID=613905 RepID=UPI0010FB4594|nr:uncharacterized protein LOC114938275 [Nylanderia fulva]
MEMKFLVILFAAVIIGAQCRSIDLSDVGLVGGEGQVATNMPEQLKELMTSYEKNFGKLLNVSVKINEDKDNNEQGIQFLNQLSSLMTQLDSEQSIPGSRISQQIVSEQTIPDQSSPDQIIPKQTIPDETISNRREAINMYTFDNDSIWQTPNNKSTRAANDLKELLTQIKDILNQEDGRQESVIVILMNSHGSNFLTQNVYVNSKKLPRVLPRPMPQ